MMMIDPSEILFLKKSALLVEICIHGLPDTAWTGEILF